MAQSTEDVSVEELDLQYFCHNCDQIVTDIEYTEDGTIKCKICNEQYVEIIEPDDDTNQLENNNASNNNNNNNNNNQSNINNNQNPNPNQNQNQNINFRNA
eukprot:824954_1